MKTDLVLALFFLMAGLPTAFGQGQVVAWGKNFSGQTNVPSSATNAVAIAAGGYNSVALLADGTVAAWGMNSSGESDVPAGLSNVVAIVNGGGHNLALGTNGTVTAWGWNDNKQADVPAGLTNAVALAANYYGSYAIRADGTVVAWGDIGKSGPGTNIPAGLKNVVSLATSFHQALAVRVDGTVVAWGNDAILGNVPAGLSNVVATAATYDADLALKSDGSLVAWGNGSLLGGYFDGQTQLWYPGFNCTNLPPGLTNVVAITGGYLNFAALRADGSVVIWGDNGFGQTNLPPGLSDADAVLTGWGHALALRGIDAPRIVQPPFNTGGLAEDSVLLIGRAAGRPPLACQWRFNGTNLPGATMPWLLMTNFQPAQTGQYTFVSSNAFGVAESSPATVSLVPLLANAGPTNVLLYSGDVLTATAHGAGPFTYQWFLNDVALADQTNRTLILSGTMTNQPGAYSVLISNSYGSVAAAAPVTTILDSAPFIVTQPQPAQRIAWPGGTVTFLANADGSKTLDYQWLFNGSPLSGATTSTLVLSNLTFNRAGTYSLQAANSFGTAISSNATLTLLSVATWGSTNNYGLGTVPLDLTNDVIAITAGYTHSVALKSNGTVVAWGNNSQGQTSVPANLSNVVAVAAAWSHTVALKADGTVVSWGDRTNVPAGLTNVIAVAAGDFYSMALKADGTVVAWGSGTVTNVPPTVTNVIAIAAGGYFGAALRADRTVIHWTGPTGTTPSGMTNVVAIAANEFPLVALRADGTLAVAGVTPPAGLSNIVAVAAGRYHALALKSDGTVTNWTSPSPVTPAGLRNVQTIASGQEHCLAILGDGPSAAAFAFSGAARQTNQFSFVTPSQYGRIYLLEYKNALGESNWKPLLLHPGVSNSVKLTDASATNAMRFYRVREW